MLPPAILYQKTFVFSTTFCWTGRINTHNLFTVVRVYALEPQLNKYSAVPFAR